jgi:hypothetical protein
MNSTFWANLRSLSAAAAGVNGMQKAPWPGLILQTRGSLSKLGEEPSGNE